MGLCMSPVTIQAEDDLCSLIKDGKARAVIVTADAPNPIVELAVEELVGHLKLATGVVLPVVTESAAAEHSNAVRVYVGETRAARATELDTGALANDAFFLRVHENAVYVLGAENDLNYDPGSGRNGTLHGIYELLERGVGVRWLWPGELGTHVPQKDAVTLARGDDAAAPRWEWRHFRIGHVTKALRDGYDPKIERLAFSPEGLKAYRDELEVFLRRHRLGLSQPPVWVTHHSLNKKYLKSHPDWFAMNAEGQRVGPTLNVSNPALVEHLAQNPQEIRDKFLIMIGEADERFHCHSPESMAMDEPLPEWDNERFRVTSNRYARFAAAVRDRARELHPERGDLMVSMFIYMNYFHAPTIDIDLSGVHGSFCPWFGGFNPWYPMPEIEHRRLMDTWTGWRSTGMEMAYRPNYLLTGYVMPHLSTWQTGEMFKHVHANGARGFDQESLWGQWAVRGPMLYMHMRLGWDPSLTIEEVRREYFDSFGPAAKAVEAYFDYWEAYSANEAGRGGVHWSSPEKARRLYPEAAFTLAREKLAKARDAAQNDSDPVYSRRVQFLEVGLRHAELAAEFIGTLRGGRKAPTQDPKQLASARRALADLIAFRRQHEHLYFADFIAAATSENRGLQIEELFDESIVALDRAVPHRDQPWQQWMFRPDPHDRGVAEEWHVVDSPGAGFKVFDDGDGRAFEFDAKHWARVSVPARLADTLVGEFSGYGWYATTFTAPAAPENGIGQAAQLQFDGVAEQAWIYLNGRFLGEHTVDSANKSARDLGNQAFTVRVPAGVIQANGQNLLMVRIHSSSSAAGIWRKVSLKN